MDPARRRFLKLGLFLSGSAALGAIGFVDPYRSTLREFLFRLPAGVPPGELDPHALTTLVVATQTLIGEPIATDHYADFFVWHARNRPGYRELYRRFVRALDQVSMNSAGCRYIDCDLEQRQTNLQSVLADDSGLVTRAWAVVFAREQLLFARHIAGPVLALFARTDAWVLVGYEGWPGQPRGHALYTEPPAGIAPAGPASL